MWKLFLVLAIALFIVMSAIPGLEGPIQAELSNLWTVNGSPPEYLTFSSKPITNYAEFFTGIRRHFGFPCRYLYIDSNDTEWYAKVDILYLLGNLLIAFALASLVYVKKYLKEVRDK